ncbi:MAG: tRNA 2-thiouridine(34) synthase MnmA [Synergistaceae bacterium]|jgi:tRNA-specific 2-thiouridylase|nr:tRNA 2-thiouridine(34) synthase MnmA [Synergistaceae bacterium]
MRDKNVMIAMSGGVDSSVAACLLKEAGYACTGVTMKLFGNEDIGASREDVCCSLKDSRDARSVAGKLDIPHYVFNFTRDFEEQVIERFIREYEQGRTPNPCVDCNRYLKFMKLFSRARQLGFDYIATGHYARIERDGQSGRFLLKKALDRTKDQSYVLYMLTQEQLSHTILPLGGLKKSEVREIAQARGFINAAKSESQDICFVPDGRYADFIEQRRGKPSEPGNFIGESGEIIGRHRGLIRYTIGQRRRLGVSFPERVFVSKKNAPENTITLGSESSLYSSVLIAEGFNLISRDAITAPLRVSVMTRYRQEERPATVEGLDGDKIRVVFDEPQMAAAPGQAVVLYEDDVVLGGGTIVAML